MKYIDNPNTKCNCSNPRHHAKWLLNKSGIKQSIARIIKTKDIGALTKDAYDFVINMSGFIAHYNHNGFMSEYNNVADFVRDLQNSSDTQRPDYYTKDGFFSKGEQAEYYADKTEILQFIAEIAFLVADFHF